MLSVLKREAWRTGGVALYLFLCLGFFTTLGKLLLATYQIEYYPLLPTVIGTLALAKVVVLLDMTPVALHLETRHPIWMATLLQDAVLLCRQRPSADPGKSLALSPRGRLLEGRGRADLGTRRSTPRTSQSSHCRPRLWLLPPLPWN